MSAERRVAVVTGGGGGIGAAVARALARDGTAVALAGRTRATVERVAAELQEGGSEAAAFVCDVTDPADVAALARAASEALGPTDILVNNAGVAHSAPLARITLDDWNRLFAVNATGTLLCMQAFTPGMIDRGWGRVINIASVAGVSGDRYIGTYAASKHAVIGLTRCAAAEFATLGVTVNAVCPGFVDTEMTQESVARIRAKAGLTEEAALEAIVATNPQRRLLAPDEVAHAVRALCADDARGINGQAIVLDGGGLLS